MTPKRMFWVLCTALAVSFVILVGSVYGITNLLKVKSAQLATNKAQLEQLTDQQNGLARSKQEIAKYSSLETVTKAIVPQDKDQAETVREITNIASASHVTLTTITFPTSSLGLTTVPSAPGAVAAVTPSPAATSAKSALSQLTPVAKIPGVYNLQITIANNANNSVTFTQLDAFLQGLENNRHTAAVSSLSIQPQTSNPDQLVFSLIINDYVKPS